MPNVTISPEERTLAALTHLSGLSGWLAFQADQAVLWVVLECELARVIELFERCRRVVRVAVADESVLERIVPTRLLLGQSVQQRFAGVAALAMRRPLGIGTQRVIPELEAREFVGG